MTNHKTLPMWVLLAHDMTDDTLFVICHWHYKPTSGEMKGMAKGVCANIGEKLVFRLAEIPDRKQITARKEEQTK